MSNITKEPFNLKKMYQKNKKQYIQKPSELMEMALKDFKQVLEDERYRINMATYHSPDFLSHSNRNNSFCAICFAGATIAKTLKVSFRKWTCPREFKRGIKMRLIALDLFRRGLLLEGIRFYLPTNSLVRKRAEKAYSKGELDRYLPIEYDRKKPQKFIKDIEDLIKYLKKFDL